MISFSLVDSEFPRCFVEQICYQKKCILFKHNTYFKNYTQRYEPRTSGDGCFLSQIVELKDSFLYFAKVSCRNYQGPSTGGPQYAVHYSTTSVHLNKLQ